MLVIVGVHFPKTHDLRALGNMAETQLPIWQDLYRQCVPLTGWGYAYRYPGVEEEGPPSDDELQAALDTTDQLADHRSALVAPHGT
jgi:HEPN domain-containing protein